MRPCFYLLESILLALLMTGFNSFSSTEQIPGELMPNILFTLNDDLSATEDS